MTLRLSLIVLMAATLGAANAASAATCASLTKDEAGAKSARPWVGAATITDVSIDTAADLAALPRPSIVDGDLLSLKGVDLRSVDLRGICFEGGDLSNTRWRKADGVAFVGVNLKGADWRSASMRGAFVVDSNLTGIKASRAILDDAVIAGGTPAFADLTRASLRGAVLRCGLVVDDQMCTYSVDRTDARGVDLTAAQIINFPPGRWKLDQARLDRTTIGLASIQDFATAAPSGSVLIASAGYEHTKPVSLTPEEFRMLIQGWTTPAPNAAPPGPAPPPWLKPGVEVLYIDSDRSTAAFRQTPLYHRLLPVVIASSSSTLAVRGEKGDRISVIGLAWGSNAHTCGLYNGGRALVLEFDKHSGWFVDLADQNKYQVPSRRLRLADDMAEVVRRDTDCGMRANWSPMRKLPVDAAAWEAAVEKMGPP